MIDKGISYKDQRLTEKQKKKIKPAKQGGGPNYLGKQETVTVPKKWLSDPDHVVAELAYITPKEKKILIDLDLYGSLNGKPNRGPAGIQSLQGDMGGWGGTGGGGGGNGGGGGGGNGGGGGGGGGGGPPSIINPPRPDPKPPEPPSGGGGPPSIINPPPPDEPDLPKGPPSIINPPPSDEDEPDDIEDFLDDIFDLPEGPPSIINPPPPDLPEDIDEEWTDVPEKEDEPNKFNWLLSGLGLLTGIPIGPGLNFLSGIIPSLDFENAYGSLSEEKKAELASKGIKNVDEFKSAFNEGKINIYGGTAGTGYQYSPSEGQYVQIGGGGGGDDTPTIIEELLPVEDEEDEEEAPTGFTYGPTDYSNVVVRPGQAPGILGVLRR